MPTVSKRKSPSLPDLQRWMRGVLTHPKGVAKGNRSFLHVIGETPELNRIDRLAIYGDGYFLRLIDCLGANYSAVQNVLGHHAFHKLAHDYLVRYPSHYKCIDDVGAELATFIRDKQRPFLSDLARLEWAAHEAMYADDLPPLKLKPLTATSQLILDPSVHLLRLQWPVDNVWRTGKFKNLKKKEIFLLVYRRYDKLVRAPRLLPAQYQLLNSLKAGKTLGQSLAGLKVSPRQIQKWFGVWTAGGVIRDFESPFAGSSSPAPVY